MSGFDLLARPLVFVPVKWKGVEEDENGNARPVEHIVDLQFDILDRDEFAEWLKRIGWKDDDPADDLVATVEDKRTPEEKTAAELEDIKRVVKGWRVKAGGRPAEFNDENLLRLIRFPGFVTALGATYMKAWTGQVELRSGNSAGSPDNGPAGGPTGETNAGATSKS